jgi:hypothetical protein
MPVFSTTALPLIREATFEALGACSKEDEQFRDASIKQLQPVGERAAFLLRCRRFRKQLL